MRLSTGLFMAFSLVAGGAAAAEDVLSEAIARNPDRFAARAIDLIAGFGGPEGLTGKGIDAFIALERAGARASAMRRFLAMDLDADGAVQRAELVITQQAAGAPARGRMERQFAAADTDGDNTVDAAELAAAGRIAGQDALDEDDVRLLQAILQLDSDGNDAVTAAELASAIAQRNGGD